MKQPFFIVGLMRSGSTYLYRLLADHPQIGLTNESRVADFIAFCCRYSGVKFREVKELDFITPTSVRGFVQEEDIELFSPIFVRHAIAALEEYYLQLFAHKQFTHWGEKLPTTGAALAMQKAYPHARYIILVRDPRDAWCSVLHYRATKRVRPEIAQQTAGDWGKSWNNVYDGYLTYLNHFLEVHYEDLVRNPLATLTEILDFLGLAGAQELVDRLDHEESFRRHGSAPSAIASIGRWEKELTPETVGEIEHSAAKMMLRFGYRPSANPS